MSNAEVIYRPELVAPVWYSNQDTRRIVWDMCAKGATQQEFGPLMEVAREHNLNPLLRQIYFTKRYDSMLKRDVWTTMVSIDGLRVKAQRSGVYDGQDEPEFTYEKDKLVCAKVRIYRKDWTRPVVGVAHFSEYAQYRSDGKLNAFWATKPHIMLAKCAESLAIRKAFPDETSGLYTPEEMGAKDADLQRINAADPEPVVDLPQLQAKASSRVQEIMAMIETAKSIPELDTGAYQSLLHLLNVRTKEGLTQAQVDEMKAAYKARWTELKGESNGTPAKAG